MDALQCLAKELEIELIVTKPPKKNSAGKLFKNIVHQWGVQNNISVITPNDKTELTQRILSGKPKSKLGVVLDYGIIIPAPVISYFKLGIINSHFSLLPKYRGADPIRSAILHGDKQTGVTIIRITPKLDDGPILTWSELPTKQSTAPELREKLSVLNCALLPETIKLYTNNKLEPIRQDESRATYTQKASKLNGELNPAKTATQLEREVRAYAGWPKSYLKWQDKICIIHKSAVSNLKIKNNKLLAIDKRLYFGCNNGSLEILEIQPEAKATMSAKDFINGYL